MNCCPKSIWFSSGRWSNYIEKRAQIHDRELFAHISKQIAQIQRGRSLSRISPATTVQYVIESLAESGLSRHLQFMESARRYAERFRVFLIETDRGDSMSPHAPWIPQGASGKPVNFNAIPKFSDTVTFSGSLNATIADVLLLILFLMILFALAYLSFLRADI